MVEELNGRSLLQESKILPQHCTQSHLLHPNRKQVMYLLEAGDPTTNAEGNACKTGQSWTNRSEIERPCGVASMSSIVAHPPQTTKHIGSVKRITE